MKIATAILAAGSGTRVGGPKALLRTPRGETYVERIVLTARSAGIDESIVVVAKERDDVRDAIPAGARVLVNEAPERGQLSSLKLAVAAFDGDALLAWPVDHPFVRIETVRTLAGAWRESPSSIVVPRHGDRGGHPTIFPRRAFAALLAAPNEEGARHVLRRMPDAVRRIDVDDPAVVRDVDTPDDLARTMIATRALQCADTPSLLRLFEACASSCFCRYWHFFGDKNDWLARCAFEAEKSREEFARAIANGSEEASGVVATAGGEVVGWAKVAPAASLRKLYDQRYYRGLPMLGSEREGVYAVGCMLVRPDHRRLGVALALARKAAQFARACGAYAIEAFPRSITAPVADEELFMGPERAYVEAGFRPVVDARPYPVLRLELRS